ncbi:hypothetical protein OV450_5834 [Actinobacteria bacterium OV450]|nr:hypothetical protein OV450_5834 [Actinobacteria bacterium OV450]
MGDDGPAAGQLVCVELLPTHRPSSPWNRESPPLSTPSVYDRVGAASHAPAEAIYRQAADVGQSLSTFDRQWPHGLEPGGSPTRPEA